MKSETASEHQKQSSKDITCGVITLSDSRKSKKADYPASIWQRKLKPDIL